MNYKDEAKEIISCSIQDDSEETAKALLKSLLEFSDYSGIKLEDLRELIQNIHDEIACPEIEEKEVEDPICEIYSGGIFDS